MTDLTKPLKRRTVKPFKHYHKPVIVELVPGDVIRLRLLGQRDGSAVSINVHDLYFELVKRKVAALKADRAKKRRAKKFGKLTDESGDAQRERATRAG